MLILPEPIEFVWDQGNIEKNWKKHLVTSQECEEVFFDPHKRLLKDTFHSGTEIRYILLGENLLGRFLFIVFTIRDQKVRVISARDLSRRERKKLL